MSASLKTIIDWETSEEDFKKQIEDLIALCKTNGKSITLPMLVQPGLAFGAQLSSLLLAINCKDCNAPCCQEESSTTDEEPDGSGRGIAISPVDVTLVKQHGYSRLLKNCPEGKYLDYPCPFFTGRKGQACSIYNQRPVACMTYPIQFSGSVGEDRQPALSVCSRCPEARRITRLIYLNGYRLLHKFKEFKIVEVRR